jgi:hypothetical protein
MHLGVEHCDEVVKRYLSVEDAHAADMHWGFLLLEVKKARVYGGESTIKRWL